MLLLIIGCMPLRFEVDGNTAIMTGDMGSNTERRFERLLENNPDLEWLELVDCPGSRDDDAVVAAGRLLRKNGINTRVPADGEIYSGAVDLFASGETREYYDGGIVGVHSWKAGNVEGGDLPKDDPEHDMYLEYYEEMGLSDEFYWFTLEAASYDEIHEMTREELIQYGFISD